MIFKQAQEVLDGRKRQTRRPVNPGDMASHDENGRIVAVYRRSAEWDSTVNEGKMRLLWKVGKDYAVQAGRGKRALGRTPKVKAIRRERLQEIGPEDVFAEMATPQDEHTPRGVAIALIDFMRLWKSLYHKEPDRWEDNPEVWVLEFEPIERGD